MEEYFYLRLALIITWQQLGTTVVKTPSTSSFSVVTIIYQKVLRVVNDQTGVRSVSISMIQRVEIWHHEHVLKHLDHGQGNQIRELERESHRRKGVNFSRQMFF